jgi:uncharacterized phage protein (predicted DNA packaging)
MIVTLDDMKQHLNITTDNGGDDDRLITGQIEAAQGHVTRLLGFDIEAKFPGDTVPAELKQAVKMLAAHWYENRETVLVGISAQEVPHGVWSIVSEHREYSFDG